MEPSHPRPAKNYRHLIVSLGKNPLLRLAPLCAKESPDGKWRNDRVLCACAIGPIAVEFVALADCSFAGCDMDSRWSGSHIGGRAGRSLNAPWNTWVNASSRRR